ncbi:DUF4259 domain-containing protein [Chitinophaga nivalis]|uniref:DUF4259 domain-containing protein n=1 Tax=Chitinophaga nivalis TaxID=2991709 RepID=A0ABT3INQ5_9BACT|nr:DUF4259 domain-containing protein [Chitinophaga nivalis]MCW3464695.1 DUF4259 domain-containing protein [Chitinophaga nivalis]MCW3485614.1 DUF4259 domain-containing protein [Chitinophaga nivalis]
MGAWGTRNFENEVSQDWIFDVIDSKDGGLVSDTLARIINNTETLEVTDCEEGLAAAELVAALVGRASEDFPEDPLDKLDVLNLIATRALRNQAIAAVNKITAASEMKNTWEEAGKANDWAEVQAGLIKRLD